MRKYKEYLKKVNSRHAKRSLKRRLVFKRYKNQKNKANQGVPFERQKERNVQRDAFWDFRKETAPSNFSLLENPEETIAFLRRLLTHYDRRQKVYVHLTQVKNLTNDAIVVLLSIMIHFRSSKLNFNGDFPQDEEVRRVLTRSGFFSNLYNKIKDEERYNISNRENNLFTHAYRNVDSVLSDKIIEQASLTVWNVKKRCLGLQRVFLELMQNTNNHASIGKEGEKLWWVSVDHNKDRKVVSFSFIDFGIGIFNSLQNKNPDNKFYGWREKMNKAFNFSNNAELLKLILQGNLHKTVTGNYYRGKGLPGIQNEFNSGSISNLHIIANDVYADIEKDKFITLSNSLLGTFVYWELNEQNNNLTW